MLLLTLGALVGLAITIVAVALFVWLLWWLWTHREGTEAAAIESEAQPQLLAAEPASDVAEAVEKAAVVEIEAGTEAAGEQPVADDLELIEGIGPKIARVLQDAGITTFAQLADADLTRLEQILTESDPRLLRIAHPAGWHEQAALAAAGEWEALQALQNELRGGRRR